MFIRIVWDCCYVTYVYTLPLHFFDGNNCVLLPQSQNDSITICTSECEWQTKGIHEVKGLWCPGKKNSLHFIIVFKCTNRTEFIEVGKLYVYKRLIKIHINVIMIQLYRVCVCACKINSKVCLSLNSISILNAKIFIPLRQIC